MDEKNIHEKKRSKSFLSTVIHYAHYLNYFLILKFITKIISEKI